MNVKNSLSLVHEAREMQVDVELEHHPNLVGTYQDSIVDVVPTTFL
jgi:hypothetical protein